MFNAEEQLINDYFNIVKVVENPFSGDRTRTLVASDIVAQKQNRLFYNVYENGVLVGGR